MTDRLKTIFKQILANIFDKLKLKPTFACQIKSWAIKAKNSKKNRKNIKNGCY